MCKTQKGRIPLTLDRTGRNMLGPADGDPYRERSKTEP